MNPNAMAIVYEDVKEVLDKTVGGFVRKYGGEFEELRAQADLIFVAQAPTYDPVKVAKPFETWLRYWVWYSLLDGLRASYAQCRKPTGGLVALDDVVGVAAPVDPVGDITEGLSPDAVEVAALALQTPPDMQRVIVAKGGTPRNHLSVYREHFVRLGWTSDRVTAAFTEIRNSGTAQTVSGRGC
jgi:hypothetical protein